MRCFAIAFIFAILAMFDTVCANIRPECAEDCTFANKNSRACVVINGEDKSMTLCEFFNWRNCVKYDADRGNKNTIVYYGHEGDCAPPTIDNCRWDCSEVEEDPVCARVDGELQTYKNSCLFARDYRCSLASKELNVAAPTISLYNVGKC